MPETSHTYQALAFSTHGRLRWQRYTNYAFSGTDNVAALVAQEAHKAAMCLPLAWVPAGEGFALVAVQGVVPGHNALVLPDGRWRAPYVPAAYRSHPFRLAQNEQGQTVLCVAHGSGLLSDTQGEALFEIDGQPSESVHKVLQFLQQVAADTARTQQISAVLQAHGLLVPWPVTLQTATGAQQVQGLYQVDEAKLNALDGEALQALQRSGAMAVAYCQLLSKQHLQQIAQWTGEYLAAQAAVAPAATSLPTNAKGELDLEFLNQGGTLSFSGL